MSGWRDDVLESALEADLTKRVEAAGGEVRKVTWAGRRGAPDRLVLLPMRHFFVELKAASGTFAKHQTREIAKLRYGGFEVFEIKGEHELQQLYTLEGL